MVLNISENSVQNCGITALLVKQETSKLPKSINNSSLTKGTEHKIIPIQTGCQTHFSLKRFRCRNTK